MQVDLPPGGSEPHLALTPDVMAPDALAPDAVDRGALALAALTPLVPPQPPAPLEEVLPPAPAGPGPAAGAPGQPALSRRRLLAGLGLGGVAAAGAAVAGFSEGRASVPVPAPEQAAGPASGTVGFRRTARVMWGAVTTEPVLALTFDDGPTQAATSGVLDILAREGVRATFFLVGSRAVAAPDLVRREIAARHEVGNHSWSHADLGRVGTAQVQDEVERAHEALARLTGRAPTVLRPPYGHISGQLLAVAGAMGYDVALWTVGLRERQFDAAGNVEWMLGALQPGTTMLAHDDRQAQRAVGLAALPGIIRGAKQRGYRFVTVPELIALDQGR